MSTTVDRDTGIRSSQLDIPQEQIDDLRRRIGSMRWPTAAPVPDRSQGVQLATLRAVARYWADDDDWGRCQARSWAETVYPGLAYFKEVDRGGHFAAWEEPELFSADLRAAFRSVR